MLDKIAALIARFRETSGLAVFAAALLLGLLAANLDREQREGQRQSQLQALVARSASELASKTLNGNIMGALSLLGLSEPDIKAEAAGKGGTFPGTIARLGILGDTTNAEGAFIVTGSGLIGSAWDKQGKLSTGFNVSYRPYFKTALQGQENVYAGVSSVRGERMLYFAAPVFEGNSRTGSSLGAVVARTGLHQIDELLRTQSDISLLISPQGVVFAGNHPEWIGYLAAPATPERIQAIRDVKQFGEMFNQAVPQPLPFSIDATSQTIGDRRHVAARAAVQWFDPLGPWTLVLLEDVERSVPIWETARTGIIAGTLFAILGALLLRILAARHAQDQASLRLRRYADEQTASAENKSRLAKAGVRFQQAEDLPHLAQCFLDECHRLAGSPRSALYAAEESGNLRLLAAYGCFTAPPAQLAAGEGLLGECARQKNALSLEAPADKGWQIRSGLGECQPQTLLLTPVLFHDKLVGALELALLRTPAQAEQAMIDELVHMLAVNLEVMQRNQHIQHMLAELSHGQQALTGQISFQQALIDTLPNPLFYKGADTRFIGFNRAYETTFGIDKADLIGKRVLDLTYLPEADRLAYQAEDELMIATAGTVRHEIVMPFADGRLHKTIYSVSGFKLADGTPGGLIGTFIDVGLADPAPTPFVEEEHAS